MGEWFASVGIQPCPVQYDDLDADPVRFQVIADIDFERASAPDLTDLIDFTLIYLSSRQP